MVRSAGTMSSIVALVAMTACGAAPDEPAGGASLGAQLERATVVDMTHALSTDSAHWPSAAGNPFEHRIVAAHPSGAAIMGAYSTPEHHGTHLDAPTHGGDGLATVDQIPVRQLVAPAVVIDVSAAATAEPDYALTVADIERWEAEHGRIPAGAVVLMSSGWGARYPDQRAYAGLDDDGQMHFPGFSAAAGAFLVRERRIAGIGVDTLSVDPGSADGFPAHGAVNGAGGYHLENVANVDQLPPAGATLVVAPIKIAGGSGGQVRIFGLIPADS